MGGSLEAVEHEGIGRFGAREMLADLLVGSVVVIRISRAIRPSPNLPLVLLPLVLC